MTGFEIGSKSSATYSFPQADSRTGARRKLVLATLVVLLLATAGLIRNSTKDAFQSASFFWFGGDQDPDNQLADKPNTRASERQQMSKLLAVTRKLKPLHSTLGPVQPGDWLASHPEFGQTFRQYVSSRPIRLTAERNILYVQPLGDFNSQQRKILGLSAEYLSLYFQCKVKTLDAISLKDVIPPEARRLHPTWGVSQIKSTYILEHVLPPRLPDDGVALICFTVSDLYPDDNWNFVFGQAMLQDRVGVWSMNRHGDAETEYDLCLRRTLKVAVHETGHMFSMNHCTAYECNMCGSNSLAESDRRPLYPCQECEAKISYATSSDTVQRLEKLQQFCEKHKLTDEAEYYSKAIQLLR
jgi:archaemetzincin